MPPSPDDQAFVWHCVFRILHALTQHPGDDAARRPPGCTDPRLIAVDRPIQCALIRNAITDILIAVLGGGKEPHPNARMIRVKVAESLARLVFTCAFTDERSVDDVMEHLSTVDGSFVGPSHVPPEGLMYMQYCLRHRPPGAARYVAVADATDMPSGACVGMVLLDGKCYVPVTHDQVGAAVELYGRSIRRRLVNRHPFDMRRALSVFLHEAARRTVAYREIRDTVEVGGDPESDWVDELQLGHLGRIGARWADGLEDPNRMRTSASGRTDSVKALGAPTGQPYVFDYRAVPPCIGDMWRGMMDGTLHLTDSARLALGTFLRDRTPPDRLADLHAAIVAVRENAMDTYEENARNGERRKFADEMARLLKRPVEVTRSVGCEFMQKHRHAEAGGAPLCTMMAALAGTPQDMEDLVARYAPGAHTPPSSGGDVSVLRWTRRVKAGIDMAGSTAHEQWRPQRCCATLMHRVAAAGDGGASVFTLTPEQREFRLFKPVQFNPTVPVVARNAVEF